MRTESPLALLCAVDLEAAPLRRALQDARPTVVGRRPATEGHIGDTPVVLAAGGMGKTNAAQATTALLERGARGVLSFGVAGAFTTSGLRIGELALAEAEVYGDDGVAAPDGWLSSREMGIPLLADASTTWYNEFAVEPALLRHAAGSLEAAGLHARTGRFVTVSCCSGTRARGDELARRFDAVCESMEGAAVAHVCALYGVPFLELRAVSNLVEDRDLTRWRLDEAVHAAAAGAYALAAAWPAAGRKPLAAAADG